MLVATTTAPAPITLADLDTDWDFGPLDDAIESARPGGCREIEFHDDNHKRGYRALEFDVRYVAGHEWDEDGCSPVIEKAIVAVKVTASMTIAAIVTALTGEINDLITN